MLETDVCILCHIVSRLVWLHDVYSSRNQNLRPRFSRYKLIDISFFGLPFWDS